MVAMMDTLAIYEQFRAVLGEERAKGFAQTLGTMIEEAKNAATKEDIRLLRESLDVSTSRLDTALAKLAEAQERTETRLGRLEETVQKLAAAQERTEVRFGRLEETVQKLAEAQERTEVRFERLEETVQKLAEAQERTEARLGRLEETVQKLAEAQARTEANVRELTEAQIRTEAQLERLAALVEKLFIRTDRHEGMLLELMFRDRLPSYLGLFLRRAKVLQPADLLDELEPRLDRSEVEDFLRSDLLARGSVDGKPTYVVGEVSYTADADDIERAARRAGLLRKADLPAVGLVACETVQPQTLAYAREQGVQVWADGRLVDG